MKTAGAIISLLLFASLNGFFAFKDIAAYTHGGRQWHLYTGVVYSMFCLLFLALAIGRVFFFDDKTRPPEKETPPLATKTYGDTLLNIKDF